MSDIEVSTALRRARLVGNGTAGPFAFTFEINNQSDIKVYVDSTLKTLTTHYTVTINTNGTGSVSFTTGNHPTNSQKVTIVSDVPVSRTSVYTSGGNITAASLESDFDKHTMMIGDQKERTLRALSAPVYDPLDVTLVLPDASTRASKFLSFDLAGNITVSGLNSINALTLSDLTVTNPIFTVNGTTGAPAIAPTSNTDTGVAFINGSGVQIIVDGSIAGNFGASSSSVGILSVANGSQSTPGLNFGNNTGLYHANNKMYIGHNNNETIEITNAATKLNSNQVNLGPSVAVIGNNMQGINNLTASNATISSTLTVDDVTFSGATAGASWNRGTNRFILNDNATIAFGTDQDVLFSFDGTDLQITGGDINHVGNFETDQLALTTATNSTTVNKILNEASMFSNDASALVTQASVKSYVDTRVALYDSLEEILASGNTTGSYTLTVDTGAIRFNNSRYLELGTNAEWKARHDGSTTIFTGDVTNRGTLKFEDNRAITFGTSTTFYMYSDGTNSYIKENGSGDFKIQASVLDIKNVAGNKSMATFTQDAGVDLFWGSQRRLHTTNSGAVVTGNLQVSGNVTIDGSSTTINSTTVTVDDPIFTLGGDTAPSSDDNKDRGIEFRWHNGSGAKVGFFGFDDSTGKFTFIPDATNSSEVFSGSTGTITAQLEGNADTASFMSGLSDPNADRLLMWDDSASAHAFVTVGSGLSLSGTTLTTTSTANDATITLTAGTALSGGGDFTTDQSGNETITFNLSHLGLESLADPNADRIVFWDDSAGAMQFLTVGSNLTLSGTTLSGTASANNATISLIAGTAISGGGDFTTDQSAAESITFNLNHLGLESLADPDDDRIFFWDDSAGAAKWLDLGTNLAISGTTLNATDTNTQYTAGTGLGLSSTEFSIDTAVVPQLSGNSTFTGANTFSGNNTFSGVTNFTADLEISSGNKINLNNVLYIDSGGTLYSTSTNPLYLKSTDIRIGDETGRIAFRSYDVGSNLTAALSYNSSEKLKTISSGIAVTGLITVSGTVDGRDVAADGTKLDGIASGAQVNQNAFTTVAVSGQNNVVADAASDTLTLAAGSNVTITTSDSTDTVTFAATNTTYSAGNGIGLSGTAFSVAAGAGLSQTTSGLALSHLGLQSLSDPNDDRILFWDDSAGATAFLDIGTGLSISGTTLNASTTDLSSYATQAYVTTQITNLVDSAPGTLNTLNELAAALGDDASFSTTVTNSIATKLPLAGGTLTGSLNIETAGGSVLTLKDTNGSGTAAALYIDFDDSAGSRVGYVGIGSGSTNHNWLYSTSGRPILGSGNNSAPQYYNGTSYNNIFHDGYHPNADKWTTARTLSLSGDASGSVSWDGSANVTLSVAVANDSHTHDGRYYTESESNARYPAGGWEDSSQNFKVTAPSGSASGLAFHESNGSFNFQLYGDQASYGFLDSNWGGWDIRKQINGALQVDEGSGLQRVFNDAYHPNADTLTTARTINGVSFNGSANITVADSTKLPLSGGTMTGNLTVDSGTSTTLSVKCDDGGNAIVRAGGDGQGTGVFEVTQDNGNHGGGISYNGDGSPAFVSGESVDHVTFYRISSGTRTEVFHYPHNSNTVNFNGSITLGGTVDGRDVAADGTKLDGIAANANNYSFPYTVSASAGSSTIVQRNGSGYVFANYFNTTPNTVTSGVTQICVETSNDGYIRHGTAAAVRSFLNVADGANVGASSNQNLNTTDNVTFANVTATTFTATSDLRLKENLVKLETAASAVSQINGYEYNFKNNKEETHTGLIAQEVEEVLPNAVIERDGVKSINYNAVVALLVEAVKEQQAELLELKRKIGLAE